MKTKKESKLRIAFGFVLFVKMAKRFKMLINIVGKKTISLFGREKINNPIAISKLKNGSKLRSGFGFTTFVSSSKRFTFLNIIVGKKSTQKLAYSQTPFATLSQNDVKNVRK